MRPSHLLLLAALLPLSAPAAEPPTKNKDAPAVPAPPPIRQGGGTVEGPDGAIEPEVTITTKGTEIHEEYRANGRLYMVKVIPARGKPYYLVYDERGRARRTDHEPSTIVPQWVIKTW
jgi:hypothetical protein